MARRIFGTSTNSGIPNASPPSQSKLPVASKLLQQNIEQPTRCGTANALKRENFSSCRFRTILSLVTRWTSRRIKPYSARRRFGAGPRGVERFGQPADFCDKHGPQRELDSYRRSIVALDNSTAVSNHRRIS